MTSRGVLHTTANRSSIAPLLPATLGAATVLAAVLAVLALPIIDDLGLSRTQLGWVVTVFQAVGAVLSPPGGRIADRIGARRAMLAVLALATAGFVVMSAAANLAILVASAAVLGVAQALANPATNKMIAAAFPAGRRGVITGVKQSGAQAAIFLVGVTLPSLASRTGWRTAPLVIGVLCGLLLAAAWATLPATETADHAEQGSPGQRRPPLPPATWWIAGYAFFMGMGGSPVFSFLPLYGVEEVGVSPATAGFIMGMSGLAGMAARIGWSTFAERRGEFGWPMLVISGLAGVASIAMMVAAPLGAWMLWLAAFLAYFSVPAWNSVAMLSVITETAAASAGRASGIVILGFLTGMSISPPLFGWSVDRLGSYQAGYTGVTVLFVAAALTMSVWIRRRAAAPTPPPSTPRPF